MPARIARVGVLALAFIALNPPPEATAYHRLRLGLFHFRLAVPGHHHWRRIARSEAATPWRRMPRSETTAPEPESVAPTLLYPILAWPSLDDDIFWPKPSSSWTFGYENIFGQAFARYSPQHAAELCPYRMSAGEIIMRISREIMPTASQKPPLEKLATALGQANGYLIKSCPGEIPPRPVARLQLMERQIDATIMALQIVRPPLQELAQSLDDAQRGRFNGPRPPADAVAGPCTPSTESVKRLLSRLDQAVQPTDAQRTATAAVADAFNRAARELDVNCRGAVQSTALGRLDATVARLDATWRAVQIIEVALANLQKDLNDEQNTRFNALEIASTR
jgi:hypothetical protein